MNQPIWVKICGVTTVEDAEMVAEAGASAIGLNFVASSPRVVSIGRAQEIAAVVRGRVELVGVFADSPSSELERVRAEVGLDWIQLHGDEPPAALALLGSSAMKAMRIGSAEDVERARAYGGQRLLVDALVRGALGGTGHAFDWSLVVGLARQRSLVLAGGLRPDNVALAIGQVKPFGVDTASGVEDTPGRKSTEATRAFVERAREAAAALQDPG